MSDTAKKHHYLPQFYLAGFTANYNKQDKIHVMDINSGKQWESRIDSIAYEKNLYSIEVENSNSDELERGFTSKSNYASTNREVRYSYPNIAR